MKSFIKKTVLSIIVLAFFGSVFSQVPTWVNPYPTVTNISALNCQLNVNLTNLPGNVTVYYIFWRFPRVSTPADVKAWALNPASCVDYPGTMLGGGSFTYNIADAGTVKTAFFQNLLTNRPSNQVNVTVEYGAGLLTPTVGPIFTNPSCVDLNVLTSRVTSSECVNQNLTFLLDMSVNANPQISGVYAGTTWTLVWGDGTPDMTYTSLTNSDYPSDALRTHVYSSISNCTYNVSLTVNSPAPCSKIFNVNYIVSVHGRDVPSDGDGMLLIEENGTGVTNTIQVCEASSHLITLKDISTWNCQNPLIGGLPAPKNDAPRTLQWVYGMDDGGALQNTIGQTLNVLNPVIIGGSVNTVRTINGYAQVPVLTPATYQGELSQTILIPATCRAGEYYDVYLRNWNKCNIYGVDPPVFTHIRILVIAAPSAPTAANNLICFGGTRTLTVTSPVIGNISWYSDSTLLTQVGTTVNFTPAQTASGIYYFWVVDKATSGLLCQSPSTKVKLTIREDLTQPGVISGPAEVCLNAVGQVFSVAANPPSMPIGGNTDYQWTVPAGWTITAGQGTKQITCNIGGSSGSQTVSIINRFTSGPNCPSPARTFSVTVSPLSVGGSISGGTTPLCQGSNTGIMTLSGHTGSVVQWEKRVNAGVWTVIANTATTYSEVPSSPGTWDYRSLVKSGSCSSAYSSNRTIVVDWTSVGGTISGGSTPICLGSNTGVMTLTGYTGAIVQWEKRVNAGVWTVIANTATTYSEVPSSAGAWDYRALVKSGSCSSTYSTTKSITVDPTSVGGTISGGSTPLCTGSNTGVMTLSGHTGSIVQWEKRVNAGVWTVIANTTTTYSEVPSSIGTWDYRALVKSGSCSSAYSAIQTIVVDPLSVGGTVTGGSTPICLGTNTGVMTLSGNTGSVVQWEKRINAGVWTVIANTAIIYSEVPSSAGAWDYRALVKSGSCSSAYSTFLSITVDPTSVGGIISGGSTPLCIGSNTGVMTLSGHTGSIVQWEKRVNAGVWTVIANTTTTYSEIPSSTGTWDYRALVKSGSCSSAYSANRTIVVDPLSVGGTVTGGSTPICFNVTTGIMTLSGHTGNVIQWEKRVNAGVWTVIANNTTNYSETPTSSGTWDYRALVQSGSCTSTYSISKSIIVRPQFPLAQLHDDASICNNTSTNFNIELTGGTSPYTINYNQNGVPQAQLNPYASGTNVGTGLLSVNTTYALTSVTDAFGCPAESLGTSILITVGSLPSSATLIGSGDNCFGSLSWIKSVITGGAPPYIINYQKNTIAQPAINPYSSNTNYNLGVLPVGSYIYRITSIQDLCGNFVPAGMLPGNTTINITAIPSAANTVNNTGSICNNGTTDIVLHSDVASSDFIWTVSNAPAVVWQPAKAPAAGSQVNGEGVSIAQNLAHNGVDPVTVTYTITPRGPGATACLGTAITRTVIVNPTAVITSLAAKTVCNNTPLAYTATSSTGGATFAWTRAFVAGISNLANSGAAALINESLINTTTAPVNAIYIITPNYGGCTGTPFTLTVTVNPTAVITSLAAKTVCNNTPLAYTATSSTGGATFAWTRAFVAGISNLANSGATALINESLINTTTAPVDAVYIITPSYGGCAGTPFTLTVTVNPTAVITSLAAKTVCNNTPLAYTATSSTGGATFAWTRAFVAGISNLANSGAAALINESLINTTTAPVNAIYIITPNYGGCTGTPFTLTVTVNPTAVITSLAAKTVCNNTPLAYTATSSTGGATFAWTRAFVAGISNLANSGATALINESLINTTTAPVDAVYIITPSYGGCAGTPFTLTVTVNPTAVITSLAAKTVCNNTPLAYTATSSTGGATFAWTRAFVAGISNLANSGATALINESLINTTTAPVDAVYIITPSYGGCAGTPFTLTVTVNPTAVITSLAAKTVCNNTPLAYTATSSTGGATFAWTRAFVAGISNLANSGAAALINESLINTTTAPVNAIYIITPNYGGCTGTPFTLTVTVNPTAVITSLAAKTVCNNTPLAYTATSSTGGATFAWTRAFVAGISNLANSGATALINESLINTTTAPVDAVYIITPSYGGCAGTPFTLTVTVNPTAVITSLAAKTVCNNTPLAYTATSSTGGATFAWTRAFVAGISNLANSGAAALINESLINTTTGNINAIYIITPSYGVCTGTPFTLTVTVYPTPVLSSTLSPAAVCSNTIFSYNPTSLTGSTSFNWSRATIAGITPIGPTSGINNPNETLRNLTSATIPVTYQYTLTANSCTNVQNVVVNIKPEPVISNQTASVCSGNSLDHDILMDNFVNPGAGVLFTWPVPINDPLLTGGTARIAPGSVAHMTDLFVNSTGSALSSTYTITPTYNGCVGDLKTIIVTIGSEPVLDPGLNRSACSNLATLLLLKEAVGSVVPTDYDITAITVAGGLVANGANVAVPATGVPFDYLKNHKFDNQTGVDKTVTYRVVPKFGATCIGAPVDVVVTIHPQPVILPGQTGIVCSNVAVNKEIKLVPANTPAGSLFNWNAPTMSDGSIQGSAGVNVTADPVLKNHITDILVNYSLAPITATYTVSPTSSFGCVGTSRDVVITVNPEPATPVVSGRDKLCRLETNIVYSVVAHGGASYAWTVPAAVGTKTFDFSTNAIIINAAAVGGSGNISVIETNSFTCASPPALFAVQVYDPSAVSLVTGAAEVCANSTSVYSVPPHGGSVFAWTLPAGAALIGDPTANSVTITFGTFSGNITVKETNAAGCVTNHTPKLVTVDPLPTATISNGGTICAEGTRPLNIALTGNGPWTFIPSINGVDQVAVVAPVSPHTLTVNTQGTYTITSVTDSKTCVNAGTGNAVVNYFTKPTGAISGTTAICAGASTTITISLTGQAPYTFTYSDGVTPVIVNNFPSGTYTFTVSPAATTTYTLTALTDNNTCLGLLSGSAVITVHSRPVLSLAATNLSCKGDNTGAIDLTATGNTPFTFAWTGPDAYVAGTEDITGLKAGIYNVTVTDVNTCTSTAAQTLTEPTLLALANSGNISLLCNGATTGAGSFTASGGTAPYTFLTVGNSTGGTIVPLATTATFSNAGAGAITMRVTDAHGCFVESTLTITQPTALGLVSVLSHSMEGSHNINCNGANNGSIGLSVTGGVSPYVYSWSTVGGSGLVAGASNQSALTAGAYTAVITDANACTITGNYTLTQPTALANTATTDDNLIGTCIGSVANLNATVTGGVPGGGGYIYSWSPASGLSASNIINPVSKPAATTTYTLTVTDANNCSKTSSIVITVAPPLTAVATTSDNLIGTCPASQAQLDVNVNGGEDFGAGVYTYSWAPAAGLSSTVIKNPVAKPLVNTTYTVTVTDKNGCTAVSTVTVNVAPVLGVTTTTDDALIGTCPVSDAQLTATVTGGESAYIYLWDNAGSLSNATIPNPVAKPIANTNYTVLITDVNGCTASSSVLVNVAPALTAVASASDPIIGTCASSVSNLDVAVAGGEAAYTYKWLPATGLDDSNIKNPVAKPAMTTTYTVTVTDANLCTTTSSVTVTVQPALGVSSTADDYIISTCATSVAHISSVVTGGEAGYTYSWSPAAGLSNVTIPNPVAKPAATTTYTLTVTDVNGCTASGTITITVQPVLSATLSATDLILSTCPASTSTLNAVVTGGEPAYTYSWLPIAGLSDPAIQNPVAKPVATTTYTLTATDVNGCTTTASITITVQPVLAATATTDDNIIGTCPSSMANLDVTVTGGEAGYTYSWAPVLGLNNPFIKTPIAKPASTTTYTVTVTDANGCTTTSAILITVNPALTVTASTSDANIGTCPTSVANLTAVAAGGEAAYSYSWMPVAGLSNAAISNPVAKPLVTTTYTVIVTDANGCTASSNVTVAVQPDLAATAIASDYNIGTCASSTSTLDVNVTGGETAYTYSWAPAASLLSASTLKNPVAKPAVTTTYTVTVTDNNGCQTTSTVTVNVLPALTATASATDLIIGTCATSTSHLDVAVAGGEVAYTYSWLPIAGLNDASLKNPIAKPAATTTYTVTVTDNNGCQATSSVTITVAPVLTVVATADDALIGTCGSSVSNLLATPAGGEMPVGGYLYSWTPAAGLSATNIANPVAKPVSTTTYFITITDENGCTATSSVTVSVAPALTAVASASDGLIGTCATSKSTLDVTASGGEAGYTYSWAPAASLDNAAIKSPVAKPAVNTTYTVTVTDVNGCTTTATVTVNVAPVLGVTTTTDDALIGTCPVSDAQLTATVSGGEAAYIYLWDNAGSLSNATIPNPVAKPIANTNYTVLITDVNGCTASSSVLVNVAPALTAVASASDPIIGTCASSVSNLDVAVAGGEAAYTYKWLPATGLDDSNSKNPVAKPAMTTTYTVTVTDANLCTTTSSVTVTVQPPLGVSSTADDYIISTCATSVANISSVVTGGEAGYTYSWSPAAGLSNVTIPNPVAKPAATTTYTLTVTDVNGCTASGTITITVQPALSATLSATDLILSTCAASTSTLNAVVSGGEPAYTYSWLPIAGLSNPAIQNPVAKPVATTTYTLTATDINGCTTTASITITVQPVLAATATTDDNIIGTCPSSMANLDVTVTGGEAGYTYSWAPVLGLNNPFIKTPIAKPASTTTYTVTVTDANGCTTTSAVLITVNPALTVSASTSDANIGTCPTSTANLTAVAAGGEAAYSYSWLPVAGLSNAAISNPVAKPLVTTTYTVIVTDANGCTASSNVTVAVQPDLAATAIASDYNIGTCASSTSTLDVNVTGGETAYTYSWAPAASLLSASTLKNPVAKPAVTTTYTVTVTDNNGCQTTSTVTVNVLPALTATASATDLIIGTCPSSTSILNVTASNGEAGYTYLWAPATGLSDATAKNPVAKPAATTTYTVTVTDANGCQTTASVTITVAPVLTVTATASDPIISTCATSVSNLLATPAGGEMPVGGYLYSWSPSGSLDNANIANPVAKPASTTTYTVTITDENGCTANNSVTVNVAQPLTAVASASDPLIGTCAGSTSNLSVSVTGGEAGYTYSWNNALTLSNAAISNPVAKPAVTTTYTVTVTDINGCTTTANVTVNVAPVLTVTAAATDGLISTCPTSTSQLSATASGGEAGYTYLWNNAGSLSDANISNPVAKPAVTTTYTVTITDVNGCQATANITVNVAPALVATATATDYILSSCAASTSSFDVVTTGGEEYPGGGYTYSWAPVIGLNYSNVKNPVAKPAATTTYVVTVTDYNGCTTTSSVPIEVKAPLALSYTSTKYNGFDISCTGASDGAIDLTVAGGEAPFTYSWTGPSSYTSASEDNAGLVAGTYHVTVTDVNGCTVSTSIVLVEPTAVNLSKSANVVLPCFGDASATGSFSVSGGVGPYVFTVSGNTSLATVVPSSPTSESFSAGSAGYVAMHVVDANGCFDDDTIFVTQPALLLPGSVNGSQEVCYLGDPTILGEVTPPTNGPGSYLYQWESSAAFAGPFGDVAGANLSTYNPPAGIVATTYFRRRVNSGPCNAVWSNVITVTVNPNPVAVITGNATICPATPTPLKVNVTTGTSPYTVTINNGVPSVPGYISNTNINVSPSVYTEYTLVSVTDAKGCVSTAPSANLTGTAIINIQPDAVITVQPVSTATCEGTTTTFTFTAINGVGMTYKWQIETAPGVYANINDLAGVYSGTTTTTLSVINPVSALNGKKYRAVVSDICSRTTNTLPATLTINEKPEVILQPVGTTVCEGSNISFTITSGVTTLPAYQWQEWDGSSWTNLSNGGNYLGTNSTTLNVFNVSAGMSTHQFRAEVSGTCTPVANSNAVTLIVNTAPQITYNPHDTAVCENLPAHFQAIATGTSIDYQWLVDMNDGSGFRLLADTATLYTGTTSSVLNVLKPSRRFNNYKYHVQVTGTCNPTKTSSYAVLTVSTAPQVAVQPVSQTICEYGNVSFSVNITGANISYIWQEKSGATFKDLMDTASYIGTKTSTMSIFNIPRGMSSNQYRVIATGLCNPPVVSAIATMTVKISPIITLSPRDSAICENGNAVMSVTAEGSDLVYQWQVNTGGGYSNIVASAIYSNQTTNKLLITNAPATMNGYKYRVKVSGSCVPPVNSGEASLLVNATPSINSSPAAATICAGSSVSFIASASGPSLTYQWMVSANNGATWTNVSDNANYSGSSTSTLTVLDAPYVFDNNLYRLSVSSACVAINTSTAKLTVNDNPVVNITGSDLFPTVCGGVPMTLNGNPTGGSGSYTSHVWSGDISPLSSFNTEQTVFKTIINGTYNITYTVTDSKTCKASETVTMSNDMPNAQFTSNAVPSCGFVMVDFTNTSTRAVNYEWNFDDGSPVETGLNASHGFDNLDPSGLVKYYKVELSAYSTNGCKAISDQYITIYPKIDPTFTVTPASGCNPIVSTMITQPGAASYEWDFGDGQQQAGGYAILHQFVNNTNATARYAVTLQTTSFYGCKAITTDTVDVYPIPNPNFTISPIEQRYPDATVTITNLVSPGPWTFTYNFGDGSSSTLDSPSHTYAEPGEYKVVQIVSSGFCTDSISTSATIQPAFPLVTFDQPVPGCTPLEVQFVSHTSYANTFRWEFGDGSISTKENPTYTYFDAGTFPVTLRVTGPGGTAVYKTTLEVYATPILNFSYTPDSVYINDKPVKFFNLSGYATNYLWNFGDYDESTHEVAQGTTDNTSTEFEPVHVYHTKGWKNVSLIGWNENCSDTLLVENAVLVRPAGKFIFPNVFRPDPSGPLDPKWDKNDPTKVNKIFFPGVIESVLEYHLYIYDRWGEQIFSTNDITIGWNGYINGQLAKQGVYIWKVTGKYTNGKNFVEAGDVTLLY